MEILFRQQHRHALVVQVQEILQAIELIGRADGLDIGIRQGNSIALRQVKHHFRLETTLDVDVQFGLGDILYQLFSRIHQPSLFSSWPFIYFGHHLARILHEYL